MGAATLKRFFYVLRPVAALRWLASHPDGVLPPIDLPRLLAEGDVDRSVQRAADGLIAVKAQTREVGTGNPPAVLERFVAAQLEEAGRFDDMPLERDPAQNRRIADEYFRTTLASF